MTEKQRNELLTEMTDAVGEHVLYGSYTQTQAMSIALAQAPQMIDVHQRLIRQLEQTANLKREIEFLPSDDVLADRKSAHQGLVAPEMAVVMAYCKIHLYAGLLESDLPEDRYLRHDLERYFPAPAPRALRDRRCSRTASTARSSRPSSRTSSSIAPARRSRSGSARRPARHRRSSRVRTRSRARYSGCARSGSRSSSWTTRSRRGSSSRC